MHLTRALASTLTVLALAIPALSCVTARIEYDFKPSDKACPKYVAIDAKISDNGKEICSWDGVKQAYPGCADLQFNCVPGYIVRLNKDKSITYSRPGFTGSFNLKGRRQETGDGWRVYLEADVWDCGK